MTRTKILSILMVIIICSAPFLLFAQPDPGGDPDVPVDGGLSILLAAGLGYTIKKGWDNRKKKNAVDASNEK